MNLTSLKQSNGVRSSTIVVAFVIAILVTSLITAQGPAIVMSTTLIIATPLLFAALGGMISEKSGVVNIALEGMIIVGALVAFLASAATGSWAIAILAAMVAGATLAAVHGAVSIFLGANQIISGTAINLIGLFGTAFVFRSVFGLGAELPAATRIPSIPVWGIQVNLLTIVAVILIAIVTYGLFRTPAGLWLQAVGENPSAAKTVAINVVSVRMVAVSLSGALAALGGAFLSVGVLGSFSENMSAGRGFVALAALIVGRWHPLGLTAVCLLFALSGALGNGLQVSFGVNADLTASLPYALTLVALLLARGSAAAPAALGKTFDLRK
jgi:ABC-type uncharacterized transport system permease subunit